MRVSTAPAWSRHWASTLFYSRTDRRVTCLITFCIAVIVSILYVVVHMCTVRSQNGCIDAVFDVCLCTCICYECKAWKHIITEFNVGFSHFSLLTGFVRPTRSVVSVLFPPSVPRRRESRKLADCPQLLDVEDMVRMREPDWKCVYTYLQEFYRGLVQKGLVKTKNSS